MGGRCFYIPECTGLRQPQGRSCLIGSLGFLRCRVITGLLLLSAVGVEEVEGESHFVILLFQQNLVWVVRVRKYGGKTL